MGSTFNEVEVEVLIQREPCTRGSRWIKYYAHRNSASTSRWSTADCLRVRSGSEWRWMTFRRPTKLLSLTRAAARQQQRRQGDCRRRQQQHQQVVEEEGEQEEQEKAEGAHSAWIKCALSRNSASTSRWSTADCLRVRSGSEWRWTTFRRPTKPNSLESDLVSATRHTNLEQTPVYWAVNMTKSARH